MAVTGLIGIGFVILAIWPATCRCSRGRTKINQYSAIPARAADELLWLARVVLSWR